MEINKIWKEYYKKKDKNLKDELILNYLNLVRYIAGRLQIRFPSNIEHSDIMSWGIIGLIEAIERFNPNLQIKFETFATSRIKGAILDALRAQDYFSRQTRKMLREIEDTYNKLEGKLSRRVQDEEVAKELNLSLEEFHKLLFKVSPITVLSLDQSYSDLDMYTSLLDVIEDKKSLSPDKIIEDIEIKKVLKESILSLSEQERKVLALYYYEDLTLREISEVLEVSESRICQIHSSAIIKLRGKLRKYLEE